MLVGWPQSNSWGVLHSRQSSNPQPLRGLIQPLKESKHMVMVERGRWGEDRVAVSPLLWRYAQEIGLAQPGWQINWALYASLEREGRMVWLRVLSGERVVGFAMFSLGMSVFGEGKVGLYEEMLWMEPAVRGVRSGRALWHAVEEVAREVGACAISHARWQGDKRGATVRVRWRFV